MDFSSRLLISVDACIVCTIALGCNFLSSDLFVMVFMSWSDDDDDDDDNNTRIEDEGVALDDKRSW